MRISNSDLHIPATAETHPVKHDGNGAAAVSKTAVKPGSEAFNVQLTEIARQLQESVKSDDISHDKVAAIRDQLASGTYSISGKDVANKILGILKK